MSPRVNGARPTSSLTRPTKLRSSRGTRACMSVLPTWQQQCKSTSLPETGRAFTSAAAINSGELRLVAAHGQVLCVRFLVLDVLRRAGVIGRVNPDILGIPADAEVGGRVPGVYRGEPVRNRKTAYRPVVSQRQDGRAASQGDETRRTAS